MWKRSPFRDVISVERNWYRIFCTLPVGKACFQLLSIAPSRSCLRGILMAMYFSTDIPSLTGLKKGIRCLHQRQQIFIPNRINIVKWINSNMTLNATSLDVKRSQTLFAWYNYSTENGCDRLSLRFYLIRFILFVK